MLEEWRQGDFTFSAIPFLALAERPDGQGPDKHEDHSGLIVVSQTCDVIRDVGSQPTIIMARLIEVDEAKYAHVVRRSSPSLVAVPSAGDNIVADLSRLMTVSKSLLAKCERTEGFGDQERIAFGKAIGQYFSRPALPDDLVGALSKFRSAVLSKAGKPNSQLGKILACIDELRLLEVSEGSYQMLVFLVETPEIDGTRNRDSVSQVIEAGVKSALTQSGIDGLDSHPILITTFDDTSARDYRASVGLDLNLLSHPINTE